MPSGIAKAKGRRSTRHEGYHKQQFMVTERNKFTRARKRRMRREFWQQKGVKKSGAPVKAAQPTTSS